MFGNSTRFIRNSLILGDALVINLSFIIGYFLKFRTLENISSDQYLVLFFVYNVIWFGIAYAFRNYQELRITDFDNYLKKVLRAVILHALLITAFWVARKAFYYSREQLLMSYGLLIPLMVIWRVAYFYVIKRYRKAGKHLKDVVIVGAGEIGVQLYEIFTSNPDYGYHVSGFFHDGDEVPGLTNLGGLSKIAAYLQEHQVHEVYCSVSDLAPEDIAALSLLTDENITRLRLIPDVRGIAYKRLKMDFFEHLPVLSLRNLPLDDRLNRVIKRAFDIIFSLLVIFFVLSWLYPLMALLIKTSSKGPVLFKQIRSGQDNREFPCLKFRSMRSSDDAHTKQASRGDDRITRIGHFIRKTSIDELPQFFNVLSGQMSVVGPRPHMVKHTEKYSALIQKYMVRHFVKPGITGLAQVKGYRGETTDTRMMEARVRVDRLYVESWSFLLDIWIILRTIIGLFKRDENAF